MFENCKYSNLNQSAVSNCAILFDLDGVLVDVSDSYRKAIQETVQFFSETKVEPSEIQAFKAKGGYNNDWDLTEAILLRMGKHVSKTEIITKFQELYLGTVSKKGYIENERWLLPKQKLKALHKQHRLGIVTGRPRPETLYVLKKFQTENIFDVIVTMEDYPAEKSKPDPYPIKLALKKLGKRDAVYVGDSVDDITAARRAGARPIGCIPPGVPASHLKELLRKHGAEKILDSVDEITEALHQSST
jgi:HAD superfamily phosphatase